jgi:hypothetical protein
MTLRSAAAAALALFATLALAASPPPAESRTTTAKPVMAPKPPKPPKPPDTLDQPDEPDTPEPPDRPGVSEEGNGKEKVGVGQDIRIPAGETHDGEIVCVWGHVTIDGHVNGDVVVVAGTLDLRGTVDGDVTAVASRMDLDPRAAVNGDLTNVAGTMHRNGATVQGQVVNIPFGVSVPTFGHGLWSGWGEFSGFLFWVKLFWMVLFFVCAILLAALVPDRIRLISDEAPGRLFTAFVFGLIGYVAFTFVQIFLTLTIIGIPLVFLLYLVFIVLKWLAMCGIFHQVGSRIGLAIGRRMSLLGGILLGFLPFAILRFAPFCVGFSIWFLVEILAFGYLILTRVGTRAAAPGAPPSVHPLVPAVAPTPGTP